MATDKVAYWLDIANYDLDTAEALYNSGVGSTLLSCATRSLRKR